MPKPGYRYRLWTGFQQKTGPFIIKKQSIKGLKNRKNRLNQASKTGKTVTSAGETYTDIPLVPPVKYSEDINYQYRPPQYRLKFTFLLGE